MTPVLRPLWAVAKVYDRPHRTLRTWAARGQLTVACDIRTRELLVDMLEVGESAAARPTRRSSTAA